MLPRRSPGPQDEVRGAARAPEPLRGGDLTGRGGDHEADRGGADQAGPVQRRGGGGEVGRGEPVVGAQAGGDDLDEVAVAPGLADDGGTGDRGALVHDPVRLRALVVAQRSGGDGGDGEAGHEDQRGEGGTDEAGTPRSGVVLRCRIPASHRKEHKTRITPVGAGSADGGEDERATSRCRTGTGSRTP
ncbi:hypothetical protein GCM10010166_37160 [Couchioplanes caeruleus subsp. azureus]|nr:hypothetical protein GCM10010166_37160 [Couchioplanes caeruleus subsp. azureus]